MGNRLIKLRTVIDKQNLDAILVSSAPNITYLTACLPARQGYSGFSSEEREVFLFIVAQPLNRYIITDGRYSEAIHAKIKNFELIERTAAFSFEKILKDLAKKHKVKR
ncbi:MAG: aminopeptidase P family N-terminal domain-containing protein, partial [Candidatus Levybacteria bacterium]|nr:aminopeptidase P family N-terminal domain-containing protein [Candidatus Levybacteria bacterium]